MPVNYPKKYDEGTQHKMQLRAKMRRLGRLRKTILGFGALREDSTKIGHDLMDPLISSRMIQNALLYKSTLGFYISQKVSATMSLQKAMHGLY